MPRLLRPARSRERSRRDSGCPARRLNHAARRQRHGQGDRSGREAAQGHEQRGAAPLSLGQRIGGALQDFAKNMPKPSGNGGGGASGDAGLEGLGQQVAAESQAAQQRLAKSAAQEYERASRLLDAPQIQSAEQLASLRPGQAFRSPDDKLRYYMPEAQRQAAQGSEEAA
jgi:hypothetical protein